MNQQIKNSQPITLKKELQLQLQGVDVQFGHHLALKQIDLNVYAGERVAFVGANGSGKSTLLKCLSRILEPDFGSKIKINGSYLPIINPNNFI